MRQSKRGDANEIGTPSTSRTSTWRDASAYSIGEASNDDVLGSARVQLPAEVPEVFEGGFAGFELRFGRAIIFHSHSSASSCERKR